ncbi:MAG: glycoside hydrolase family 5 protein [Treponema sp.]|nr:glycoside hydrolase family 5 protein [Treponema sp.]
MEKLKELREEKQPFCGCTLYGSGKTPRSGPGSQPPGPPGLPFPPEEAEGRFRRLKERGVSCIRLVIAWETLEYAGPGAYDESYLAYLRKLLVAAAQTGVSVFIDPVQNRWSRWLSGEGAPPWAPEQRDKGEEWLRERYFDCMRHCFRRLKNCAALIGWGASAEDFSGPFMLRFAERMREAREGTRFFVAEGPQAQGARPVPEAGDDPEWAAGAYCCYDGSAFPDC